MYLLPVTADNVRHILDKEKNIDGRGSVSFDRETAVSPTRRDGSNRLKIAPEHPRPRLTETRDDRGKRTHRHHRLHGRPDRVKCGHRAVEERGPPKEKYPSPGTKIDAIVATEDREIFSRKLREINETLALSYPATTVEGALEAAHKIRVSRLVRAAFTLGGLGSGFAENDAELRY